MVLFVSLPQYIVPLLPGHRKGKKKEKEKREKVDKA